MLDGGKNPAFERTASRSSYGVVTLAIFAVGFGLVALGHRVGRGRRERVRRARARPCTGTSASAASGNTAASANVAG